MTANTLLLRDLLAVLFKYQRMIVMLVVLTLGFVLAFAYIWPERYQTKATLLVKPGRQTTQSTSIESPLRQQLSTTVLRKEDISSEAAIVGGRMLIEQAISDVGPDRMAPPLIRQEGVWGSIKYAVKWTGREVMDALRGLLIMLGLTVEVPADKRLVLAIEKNLTARAVPNTDMIEVTFQWPLPDVAAEFTARLVDRYLEHHVSVHKERDFYGFVKSQAEEVRRKLEALDAQMTAYKASSGIVSLAEQRSLLLTQRSALDVSRQRRGEQLADLRGRLAAISAQVERERSTLEVSEGGGRNPVIDQLRLRVATLELEEREILRRYDDSSSVAREKKQAVAEARRSLEQETAAARSAAGGGSAAVLAKLREEALRLDAEVKGATASLDTVTAQADEVLRKQNVLETRENELVRLARERQTLEGHLRLYDVKQEELRLSEVMDQRRITSVAIVEPASTPIQPVRSISLLPNRIFYILAGLLGSLVAGAALAFVRDYVDRTLDTVRKVESAGGVPVLASRPDVRLVRGDVPALSDLTERLPADARILLVCSARRGDGVSTIAATLAGELVRYRSKRVLLADCNFRDPPPDALLAGGHPGIADAAGGQLRAAVRAGSVPGLDILTRGETGSELAASLDREGFGEQLRALGATYDYVVIDAPAVLAHPDAMIVARAGVHVIFVVDARATRAEQLAESLKRLKAAGATVAGVVMNYRPYYIPAAIYRRT